MWSGAHARVAARRRGDMRSGGVGSEELGDYEADPTDMLNTEVMDWAGQPAVPEWSALDKEEVRGFDSLAFPGFPWLPQHAPTLHRCQCVRPQDTQRPSGFAAVALGFLGEQQADARGSTCAAGFDRCWRSLGRH
jgi:hypothetical protein